ncbi:MAG: RsmB/NOP family class I SAM-dependent RNA methyltransferase [archaeon]
MEEFLQRYKRLGKTVNIDVQLKRAIRFNSIKTTREKFEDALSRRRIHFKKPSWLNQGYFVNSRFSLSSVPEYLLGHYYIQEAASQFAVEALKPKGLVLDCCAAPGGKTAQIAQSADLVVALESHYQRCQVLKNNLQRLGVNNCVVYNTDVRKFDQCQFDQILVDAPCSGNYAIDKKWFYKQTIKNILQRSQLQRDILEHAFSLLKPKGELVYSTCSLEPEENEMVVEWALQNFDVKLMEIGKAGSEGLTNVFGEKLSNEIKKCRRFWPGETQGFFVAKFKK